MSRFRLLLGALLAFALCGLAMAEQIPLVSAQGVIEKVDSDTITIRPRGPTGKFEKDITLKLTGTSAFTRVGTRKGRDKGKTVVTQKNVKASDLAARQSIHFIYTTLGDEPTLLSGIVQP